MNTTKLKIRLSESKQGLINCINDVMIVSDIEVKEYLRKLRRHIEEFPVCKDKRALQLDDEINEIFATYSEMLLDAEDGGDPVSAIQSEVNKKGNQEMYQIVSPVLMKFVTQRRRIGIGGRESTKGITKEEERSWQIEKDLICLQLQLLRINYEKKFHQRLIEYYDEKWAEDETRASYFDGLIQQEEDTIDALNADEARCIDSINDNNLLKSVFGKIDRQKYIHDHQYRESKRESLSQTIQKHVAEAKAWEKEFDDEHSEISSTRQVFKSLNQDAVSKREGDSSSNERRARHEQRMQMRDASKFDYTGESRSSKGEVKKSEETGE